MAEEILKITAIHEHENCAQINVDGLEGADRKNPDLPVSLMSLDARQQVDASVQRGLCYKRFTADITLSCEKMPPTDARLQCGELVLVILPERKTCWPECELLQHNQPCPLRDGVRYAQVESPGKLCLGDMFTNLTSLP